jgi:hypothetical protein
LRLADKIIQAAGSGRKKIDIARELTNGDEKKAQSCSVENLHTRKRIMVL